MPRDSWEKIDKALDKLEDDQDISQQNLTDLRDYLHYLEDTGMKAISADNWGNCLKLIMKHIDYPLRKADPQDARKIVRGINKATYSTRTDSWSRNTKNNYLEAVRGFFKWSHSDPLPIDMDRILKESNLSGTAQRTPPSELPSVQDIRLMCQHLSRFEYQALYLFHWDTGARIGESVSPRIKDYERNDSMRDTVYIHGNKDSDDRRIEVVEAAPAVRMWLDRHHPAPDDEDALIFCQQKRSRGDEYLYKPVTTGNLRHKVLKPLAKELGLDSKAWKTHHIRKRRQVFMKNVLGMSEMDVARRLGKVPGASNDAYDRGSVDESNVRYADAMGFDVDDERPDPIMPLECEDCGLINPGWQDRCLDCHGLLEIKELENKRDDVVDRVMDQLEAIEMAGRDIDQPDEELIERLIEKNMK